MMSRSCGLPLMQCVLVKTASGATGNESGAGGSSTRPRDKGVSKKLFFRSLEPQFGLKIRGPRAPRAPPLDPPQRYVVTAVIANTVHLAISSDVVIHFTHPMLQSTSILAVVLEMAIYGLYRLERGR